MHHATANAIKGVAAIAVPGFQEKFPVAFAAFLAQATQPAGELIPVEQQAGGIVAQEFA